MKKSIIILVLLTAVSFAQTEKSMSIRVLGGISLPTSDKFIERYSSSRIVYGGGLSVPVSTRFSLVGKLLLSNDKNDRSHTLHAAFGAINESYEYSEMLIDIGGEYKFFPSRYFTLFINGGFSYVSITEKYKAIYQLNDFPDEYTTEPNGWGIWGGAGIEMNFESLPFSVIVEGQYNSASPTFFTSDYSFKSVTLMAGLRYYFKERRVE